MLRRLWIIVHPLVNLPKDEKNYALGGQAFSAWPVALSLTATSISAITIMGAPSETYVYGSTMCWGLIGDVMGCAFAAFVFIPLYWSLGVTSVNEYIDLRFGKIARLVLTVISIIQALIYNGLVVYGPGRVMKKAFKGFCTVNRIELWSILYEP